MFVQILQREYSLVFKRRVVYLELSETCLKCNIKMYVIFIPNILQDTLIKEYSTFGPLHDPVTWYKITHAGEQVAQWDLRNNAIRTSPPGFAFVLEVPCHCATCSPACVILYHMTGSCKGPTAAISLFTLVL